MTGYGLLWPREPVDPDAPPADGAIFDLIEFSYEHVAEALDPQFHSYMSHSHYTYDREGGRQNFALDVNRIFERNGMAFALVDGEVIRLAPAVIDDELGQALFQTGDAALESLLETARHKFLNRSTELRREALEKLWDAWKRMKTLEPGKDKKASAAALLDKVSSEPVFRACLEHEAARLTEIGNTFMIRHTEVDKVPVVESSHIDYLFSQMFALARLLLKAMGRGG